MFYVGAQQNTASRNLNILVDFAPNLVKSEITPRPGLGLGSDFARLQDDFGAHFRLPGIEKHCFGGCSVANELVLTY